MCTYSCSPGYHLTGGATTGSCVVSGNFAEWNGTTPICTGSLGLIDSILNNYDGPLNTPFPQRRDHWETIERPQNLTDLSTVFQWALNDLLGLTWFFNDLSVNSYFYGPQNKWFKQSLSGLWGKRTFNERLALSSTVSPVFQWPLTNLLTNATFLMNSLGHSVISVDPGWSPIHFSWSLKQLSWSLRECTRASTQWTFSGICKEAWLLLVSQRMLSVHSAVSADLHEIWWKVKFWFLESMVPQWFPARAFPQRQLLGVLETAEKSGQVLVSQWFPFCGKGA